jgi:uncharacterized metal-binding protein YceD (DUF177 family)
VSANEFPRMFTVDPLPEGGLRFEIEATATERAALARRFELLALDRLAARGSIRRTPLPATIVVEGRLGAKLAQECVVTLEPVPAELDVPFRRLLSGQAAGSRDAVDLDPLAEEPEPLAGPRLDVGELVAEELAMALDPYPRAAPPNAGNDDAATPRARPFAALARLRTH